MQQCHYSAQLTGTKRTDTSYFILTNTHKLLKLLFCTQMDLPWIVMLC